MKIKFLPQNVEVEGSPNKSLLQIATENQLEIRSICKGVPSCAECRVRIVEGDHNVLPPGKAELSLIGTSYFIDNRRLSCQVRCFGDVTVDLTEQVERTENQTKKIRGFRTSKQMESNAVNDTMLLNEKVEEQPAHEQKQAGGQPQQNQQKQQHKHQHNQNKQQKQQKPQQQAQGKQQQQNQSQKQAQQHKGPKDNRGPQKQQGRDQKKPGSNQP